MTRDTMPRIRGLQVRAVRVPMAEPHRTAGGAVEESPLVLTDVSFSYALPPVSSGYPGTGEFTRCSVGRSSSQGGGSGNTTTPLRWQIEAGAVWSGVVGC